jgi:predicted N-acetyltransferase YhbS
MNGTNQIFSTMRKATANDKALVVDMLTKSFDDNQSVNYIILQDRKRIQRIRSLMDYSFEVCSLFGEVYLSNDRKACALILYSHQKKTTLKSVWLDMKLIFKAIGLSGVGKTLKREAEIKKLQPKEPMAYLWFISVNPVDQHQGKGGKLLWEIVANAGKQGLPVYLETSTLKNLPWYEKFGFHSYGQLDLGYVLYFLKHLPANS